MTSLSAAVNSASAESLWVVRDKVSFLSTLPAPGFALLEVTVPPGSGTPPHRHASPEIFHVVAGEITVGSFEGPVPQFTRLVAGDNVSVASNVAHNYQNNGGETARMLVVAEDTMVAFFRELGVGEPPPAAPPSEAGIGRIRTACQRHGIEMLAP